MNTAIAKNVDDPQVFDIALRPSTASGCTTWRKGRVRW